MNTELQQISIKYEICQLYLFKIMKRKSCYILKTLSFRNVQHRTCKYVNTFFFVVLKLLNIYYFIVMVKKYNSLIREIYSTLIKLMKWTVRHQ